MDYIGKRRYMKADSTSNDFATYIKQLLRDVDDAIARKEKELSAPVLESSKVHDTNLYLNGMKHVRRIITSQLE